jgi:flavin-dependent dehydrogenase
MLYALCDGELAAQAVIESNPSRFNTSWKEEYGLTLFAAVRLRKFLYKKPILELCCRYLARAFHL